LSKLLPDARLKRIDKYLREIVEDEKIRSELPLSYERGFLRVSCHIYYKTCFS
ncbi:unnamed protein product, partial [marine sediment metagenome]